MFAHFIFGCALITCIITYHSQMQAPVLPHVFCDLYHAEYLLLTLFHLRSWKWWSCFISIMNSRRTLWGAKQTQDIVSNKAGKQSNFRYLHLLVMIFVCSWVSFINIRRIWPITIPCCCSHDAISFCSHDTFTNSCLLDCDPTYMELSCDVASPFSTCNTVSCCDRCTTYVYLFTKQSEAEGIA